MGEEDFTTAHDEAATSIDDGRLENVITSLEELQSDYVIEIEKYGIIDDAKSEQLAEAITQVKEIVEIAKSVRKARQRCTAQTAPTIYRKCALAQDVLAVAVANPGVNDWAVYIGSVPGIDHEGEKNLVATTGCKCSKAIATLLFPDLAEKYNWRG